MCSISPTRSAKAYFEATPGLIGKADDMSLYGIAAQMTNLIMRTFQFSENR